MEGFGAILKGFRTQRSMSQRELGKRVDLDFTYISKIENEALPPPSEGKLLEIEKALDLQKYSLVLFAGKIPNDFKRVILIDADVKDYLRDRVSYWNERMKVRSTHE